MPVDNYRYPYCARRFFVIYYLLLYIQILENLSLRMNIKKLTNSKIPGGIFDNILASFYYISNPSCVLGPLT